MGGKASLILIFGFTYLLSVYQLKMGNVTTHAADNYVNSYTRTVSHQIAVSGMNIAAAKLYEDYEWRTGMQNVGFQDGQFSISFGPETDTLEVVSIGEFMGNVDTVRAYFTGTNIFTHYTLYTSNENGVAWIPGDTVWGPLHTNSVLNHQNDQSIVFYGKVTAGKSISPKPKNTKTQFLGGYEVGVYLPEVENIDKLINAAGSGGYYHSGSDTLKIIFKGSGDVVVYSNSTALYPEPGIPLSTFAPNGAIYAEGSVEVKGVVNGMATVGAGNNIFLKDEIKYQDNPLTNPDSDDLLGLIAWNDIVFNNSSKTDWYMQAILMAVNGSLTAVDMNKNGIFNYLGSIYQLNRGNAKMFQSFNKKYRWDERLEKMTPPYYPGLSSLRLIAWLE